MKRSLGQKGLVLVFALWVLGVLTILAVSLAAGIRQKIFLIARLDERSRMNYLLESAVKKAAGYIHQQMEVSNFDYTPAIKVNFENNGSELARIMLGHGQADIIYLTNPDDVKSLHFGVVDEESKINLNKTDILTLTNLLINVLQLKDEDAAKLALSLLDWRQYGEGEVSGFFSEDYYANLQYPYPKKSADYETLEEILLVKGMTKPMYDKLINYLTIYGDGAVNINTASKEVLMSLGLQEELVDKILSVRRGKDDVDGTPDDMVFQRTYEIDADVNSVIQLQPSEMHAIDGLNARGLLGTGSYFYTIQAVGRLATSTVPKQIRAVYSARDDKIVYWEER